MKTVPFRAVVLASLASLAMATSSSAITILTYGQANTADGGIFATPTSTTSTTLSTNSVAAAGSNSVNITNIGGITLSPLIPPPSPFAVIPAFMTFRDVVSTGAATVSGNEVRQAFRGQILFTANPGGAGFNYLTATFDNAILFGMLNGGSATFQATDPPTTRVTFTSDDPRVNAALLAAGATEALRLDSLGIGLADLLATPGNGLQLSGSTIDFERASSGGTFSSNPIPEPSGLVMAGTAMLASLGCLGWRRRQSSRA